MADSYPVKKPCRRACMKIGVSLNCRRSCTRTMLRMIIVGISIMTVGISETNVTKLYFLESAFLISNMGVKGNIRDQKRRFQEIKLGDIRFTDADGHELKTYQNNDGRRTKGLKALWESRKSDTEAYVATIPVEDLMEFTAPLRDEEHGSFNFELKQFMSYVREHWKKKAKAFQQPEVTFTADYILADTTFRG